MRTTLSIRDDLYDEVRKRAFEGRRTLGEVVNELVERGIAGDRETRQRTLGSFSGQIEISDDFDEELGDVTAALDEPIER